MVRTGYIAVLRTCRPRLCLLSCEVTGRLGLRRAGLASVLKRMDHIAAECMCEIKMDLQEVRSSWHRIGTGGGHL